MVCRDGEGQADRKDRQTTTSRSYQELRSMVCRVKRGRKGERDRGRDRERVTERNRKTEGDRDKETERADSLPRTVSSPLQVTQKDHPQHQSHLPYIQTMFYPY